MCAFGGQLMEVARAYMGLVTKNHFRCMLSYKGLMKCLCVASSAIYTLDIAINHDNKGVDQTALMQRLVWVFIVCMQWNEVFLR